MNTRPGVWPGLGEQQGTRRRPKVSKVRLEHALITGLQKQYALQILGYHFHFLFVASFACATTKKSSSPETLAVVKPGATAP